MRTLGIDLGDIVSSFALLEPGRIPRQLGDGCRFVVPTAVAGAAWGSEAAGPGSAWNGAAAVADRAAFLEHVLDRAARYCGISRREMASGHTVIASFAGPSDVAAAAASAGFRNVVVISPPQALVAGWLHRNADSLDGDRVVVAAVIGDLATCVRAFTVRTGSRPVVSMGPPACFEIGIAHWAARLVDDIGNHVPQAEISSEAQPLLDLWMSAVELGDRAKRGAQETAAWIGPYAENLLSSLEFSSTDLMGYQSDSDIVLRIRQALKMAMSGIGQQLPDCLIVGGIGASWPITPLAWAGMSEPVVSPDPASDISSGAVWWPRCMAGTAEDGAVREIAAPMRSVFATPPRPRVEGTTLPKNDRLAEPTRDDRLRQLLEEELGDLSLDEP